MVRREYGGWWGAGAYAVAVTTGVMRLYNNRHWVNDLLGGAAIGILAANVGYWLLPLERRLFHLEREDMAILAVPFSSGRASGITLAMTF